MKRIKSILCTCLIVMSAFIISACSKGYNSITYKRFMEKMGDELNYSVEDSTLVYEGVYQRYLSATKDDITIIFYEFEDEESAKKYIKNNYDNKKYYSFKSNDEYSEVKYSKEGYLRIIQVDNIIISANTTKNSNKTEVNNVLKELGY